MAQEKELKQILEKLHTAIKTTNEFSREQVKINRDLLKVMSLINDGYAKNAEDAKMLIDDITDGVEDVDKFFEKWAKQRGATKKDLEEIRKKFKEIESIDEDIIESSKEYIDLLKERHNLLDDEVDLGKGLLSNYNEILKVVRESKKQYSSLTGTFDDIHEGLEKIVAKKVDLGSMFTQTTKSSEELQKTLANIKGDIEGMVSNVSGNYFNVDLHFNPLTDELDKEVKGVLDLIETEKNSRIEGLTEYFNRNKYLQTQLTRQLAADLKGLKVNIDVDTGNIVTATGVLKKGTSEFQKMADKLDEISAKNNLIGNLESSFTEIAELTRLGSLRTDEQNQNYQKLIQKLGVAGSLMVQQVDSQIDLLSADVKHLQKQKEVLKTTGKYIGQLKSAESVVMRVGQGFDYINSILPAGIGEFLGLSRVSQDLIDSHKRGVQEFSNQLGKGVSYSEAMQGYFKTFRPAILSAINPVTILVTSFILLYKFAESLTDKYKEMTQEMKISVGQARQILDIQLDTLSSQKNQFAQLKDIQAVQSAMIGSSGKVFKVTNEDAKELTLSLVNMGKYFGYGNEQAVELHKTFTRLGANDKVAKNLQKNLGYMSEMVGLSPQIIAQDLVENADLVATYFAGMPDQAAKAAIEVRKVGMSLKQAGSIAQKMLDLEGFMTDMYELYAMTGRGIDFSEAFDLGLTGDIQGMAKSMVKEIGTLSELNNMDYLTRSKIAKTMGIQVDELANMVKMNEEMGNLGKDQQKWLEQNYKTMGDMSLLSDEELKNRINQGMATDRMTVAWEKIKGVLFKALIPLAESFADAIEIASPIIDLLVMGFKGIASILKAIKPLIDVILIPFKKTSEILSSITGKLDEFGNSTNSLAKPFSELLKVSIGIFQIWAGFKALKFFGVINKDAGELVKGLPIIGGLFSKTFSTIKTESETANKSINDSIKTTASASIETQAVAEQSIKKTAKSVTKEVTKMETDVKTSVKEAKAEIEKPAKMGIISTEKAKSGFKLIGDVAGKTLTAIAIHSASSMLFAKKEGEQQVSDMSSNMESMLTLGLSSLAPLLMSGLQEGLERTFQKRMEKKIEGSLEKPIKKASKAFGSMDSESDGVFKRILNKGKSIFTSLGNFSKKLSSVPNVSGSFDAMASSAEKAIPKIETVSEVVNEVKEKTIKKQTSIDEPVLKEVKPEKPIRDTGKKMGSGLDSVTNLLKGVWNGLKTVLNDIVKFVSTSMKELSGAIGTTIKNLLKGIGDGLSSFKGSALKGAATLVVLSGALLITAKAVKNFNEVGWEDLSKAGIALAGLVGVSLLLGSASAQMLIGAAAIAVLGASLIPAAYALNMFNDVDWGSLGKAGLALVGLGVMGAAFGTFAPLLLIGSVAIAALGASLIPFGIALNLAAPAIEKINPIIDSFGNVISKSFDGLSTLVKAVASSMIQMFQTLNSVDIGKIIALGPALIGLSAGLASLAVGSTINSIASFFGGSVIEDLTELSNLTDPITKLADSIARLTENLILLQDINLGNVSDFSIDSKVNERIKPLINQEVQRDNTQVKISPVQVQVPKVDTPKKESVAQDERVNFKDIAQKNLNFVQTLNQPKEDNYNDNDMISDYVGMESRLDKIAYLLELLVQKDVNSYMDSYKTNSILKARNNR